MLLADLALLQQHGGAEESSNNAEGGERDESNHQDGHKSLLIRILEPAPGAGGDKDHSRL